MKESPIIFLFWKNFFSATPLSENPPPFNGAGLPDNQSVSVLHLQAAAPGDNSVQDDTGHHCLIEHQHHCPEDVGP